MRPLQKRDAVEYLLGGVSYRCTQRVQADDAEPHRIQLS